MRKSNKFIKASLSKIKKTVFYILLILFVAAITFLVQYFIKQSQPKDRIFDPNADSLEVTILDVGNADSILIRSQSKTMLIDAGENNDEDKIVRFLKQNKISKLDIVVATHPDADHIGGMDAVINNLKIDKFYMPILPEDLTPTTATYIAMLKALDENDVDVYEGLAGESFDFGGVKTDFLWPLADYNGSNNNFSIITRLTHKANTLLFMGDSEKEAETALLNSGINLKADFLKVGHHGSNSSTTERFIEAVSPNFAVITSGQNNRYGHPHPEVLKRLTSFNVKIYRSDLNGDITVKSDGNVIEISTEK